MSKTEHKYSNIFLTGVMGVGKSTLGKSIARQSQFIFYDSDAEVMKRSGVDISWIFEQEGETGFRRRECAVIADCVAKQNIVLATGGGCVTVAANRDALVQHGIVIHLRVSLAMQLKRLALHAKSRPLFVSHSSPEALYQLNTSRIALYESIADLSYDTDNEESSVLARRILEDCKVLADNHAKK